MTKQPKTALIAGITGQDGSYLAEFLYGDLTDSSNLGAQSSGGVRGETPLQQCHTPRWSGASPRMAPLQSRWEVSGVDGVGFAVIAGAKDVIASTARQSMRWQHKYFALFGQKL